MIKKVVCVVGPVLAVLLSTSVYAAANNAIAVAAKVDCSTLSGEPADGVATLTGVYCEALNNDPTYKQAVAQYHAAIEASPQAWAAFLPALSATGVGGVNRTNTTGVGAGVGSTRSLSATLSGTQTIFNFQDMALLSKARLSVQAAQKQLDAAQQDLMDRVATAYFNVLKAADAFDFDQSNVKALGEQAKQAQQKLTVGTGTVADSEAAKAAYESAYAQWVSDWTTIQTAREALTGLTSFNYGFIKTFAKKGKDGIEFNYPVEVPKMGGAAGKVDDWVAKARSGNLILNADTLLEEAALKNVRAQEGGHLPSLLLTGSYGVTDGRAAGDPLVSVGNSRTRVGAASLVLNVPIFQGGLVSSQVRQAAANYDLASQLALQQYRQVTSNTRTEFFSVNSGASQLQADVDAVRAGRSSSKAIGEAYRAGSLTLVQFLTTQSNYLAAQRQYAGDLYAFINNQLALKESAGILSDDDLWSINAFLTEKKPFPVFPARGKAVSYQEE